MTPLSHPLDRPVWNALTTRLSRFAIADGRAVRMDPAHGVFAALADAEPEAIDALRRLVVAHPGAGFLERENSPMDGVLPVGAIITGRAACVQMTAGGLNAARGRDLEVEQLTETDGPEMHALATLTRPGPFHERTDRLGDFIGIRRDGRLIAMAGQRLRIHGFTEISGVCTHPDHRGKGYARGLMRLAAARILDVNETPFLHAYADHDDTIALYRALGFEVRARMTYTVLAAQPG